MIDGGSIWNNGFLRVADLYVDEFANSNSADEYIRGLSECETKITIFCVVYSILVKMGNIDPIRSLSEEQKSELVAETNRLSHSQDEKHKKRLARVIYTLGQYCQL